jgi:hypothetical protein
MREENNILTDITGKISVTKSAEKRKWDVRRRGLQR